MADHLRDAGTFWAHLWVDHMLGWAKRRGGLAEFSTFKGEGRHKALKGEISKLSFRGGGGGEGWEKGQDKVATGEKGREGLG